MYKLIENKIKDGGSAGKQSKGSSPPSPAIIR